MMVNLFVINIGIIIITLMTVDNICDVDDDNWIKVVFVVTEIIVTPYLQ